MKSMTIPQVEQHVTILGWLYIVSNVVLLLVGGFILLLLTTIGAVSGDAEATAILSIVGFGVGALLAMLSIPGLAAGAGLLAHKAWARILAIVVAILNLINFPIGTLIGAYALYVLLQDAAADYFSASRPE